jgi:hypothetical protein
MGSPVWFIAGADIEDQNVILHHACQKRWRRARR